ncbi:hypothetical protein BpHYR1_029184 [Brachionus plicatilis]|uniref:Ubiquitin-like protease family profile domain-containing protein n=1 Tax=Brachionus plicatilis TaxID=10195 RepID=A0A3M7RLJ4_BRAPC|nr:hypothetical protein BpHYR1_029184 [Brachionus plicatilis]
MTGWDVMSKTNFISVHFYIRSNNVNINENGNHWTCLIIDLTKDEVIYIDPLGETEEKSNKVLESWMQT